jgi:hypothetical protein
VGIVYEIFYVFGANLIVRMSTGTISFFTVLHIRPLHVCMFFLLCPQYNVSVFPAVLFFWGTCWLRSLLLVFSASFPCRQVIGDIFSGWWVWGGGGSRREEKPPKILYFANLKVPSVQIGSS